MAELVGGAFLSAFLQVLFDRLASQDVVELFKGKKPIQKLLNRFKTKLWSANLLLKDADEMQLTNPAVKEWLDNLKEVVFRADELTDDINYEVLRRKLESASETSTSIATFDKSVQDEIEDILDELEELIAQKDELGSKELTENIVSQRWHGAPLAIESQVYGREDDKEAIIKLVVSDESCTDKVPVVVPIVGMGGIGKTTLAQLVFNDHRVENHFQIRVWVTISTQFDVFNITQQIFKELPNKVTSEQFDTKELSKLQHKLSKELEGKKFLLVLDDVWSEDYHFWDELRRPFASGASGSKIIITTRSSIVASTMSKVEAHSLRGLSNDICWKLFIQHAFENEDLNAHPDLRKIGEEIVKKCKGLPLAVKSVAALLRSISSLDEWRMILENGIWDLKLQENASKHVLPALWFSYRYLSPELKRCFAYCSIFPKDYEFTQKEVILLWMAEGFLQPKGGTRMEDVGEEYFKILTSRSLFQQLAQPDPKFIMHDCVHDLATFVLGDFGCRLEDNNFHNLSSRTRHMFVWKEKNLDSKEFEALSNAKCLRTFLSSGHHLSVRENIVLLKKLLMEKGCLRVLSLYGFLSTSELPDSVGNLKHLRYLNLSSTSIKEVPATVCTLYNLETLLLLNCRNLTQLPSDIGCLIKLRHLDFSYSPIKELPPQICDMKDLQTLSKFILCREHGNSWIKKLGDFQQLHGEFDISGLENVVDVKNVSEAKMRDKKFVTELGLYWDGDHSLKEREILDQLQPHANLKAFRISGYKGASFSDWMGDQSFTNIVRVFLLNCENLCSLSPLEQLPSLKLLFIMGFRSMETIKWEFSSMTKPFKSLESLKFWKMAEWKEWLFGGEQIFPSLKELEFDECPKLDVVLPDCFPSLTKLRVEKCRKLMPLLIPGTHQRFGFPSLQELRLWGCPEQEFALEGGFPSSLKKIFIFDCDNLKALDDKGFRLLTSLQSLNIEYCKELQRLPEELPTYPFDLVIAESPLLESRCNQNGEDWPKIKHTRLSVNKVKLT